MASARRTITIKRPVADVFAFVADGRNAPKWRPGVLDIEHASGEGSAPCTARACVVR